MWTMIALFSIFGAAVIVLRFRYLRIQTALLKTLGPREMPEDEIVQKHPSVPPERIRATLDYLADADIIAVREVGPYRVFKRV